MSCPARAESDATKGEAQQGREEGTTEGRHSAERRNETIRLRFGQETGRLPSFPSSLPWQRRESMELIKSAEAAEASKRERGPGLSCHSVSEDEHPVDTPHTRARGVVREDTEALHHHHHRVQPPRRWPEGGRRLPTRPRTDPQPLWPRRDNSHYSPCDTRATRHGRPEGTDRPWTA